MCGIAGALGTVDGDVLAAVRGADAAQSHRGPDGCGLWTSADRRCVLGHRRLSIIDLSDLAAQPMSNAGGTVTLTFNGEIYNHADVRTELSALGGISPAYNVLAGSQDTD